MFVTKLNLKNSVQLSLEKALLNSPAHYPYLEKMNKNFLCEAGENSFVKENVVKQIP